MNPNITVLKNKTYQWQGKNRQGQLLTGEITAFSLNLAKLNLQKKGIEIREIKKKKPTYWQKKITPLEILVFFRQLATLIVSGISISQALSILSQQTKQPTLFTILNTLREHILAGNDLA